MLITYEQILSIFVKQTARQNAIRKKRYGAEARQIFLDTAITSQFNSIVKSVGEPSSGNAAFISL